LIAEIRLDGAQSLDYRSIGVIRAEDAATGLRGQFGQRSRTRGGSGSI